MISEFFLVARQVAILYVLIGAGVVCRRTKLVDEFSIRGMVNILFTLVTPALVIDCFQRPFDAALFRQLGFAFVVATAVHVLAIALSYLTVRSDDFTRPVLRLATVFSNAGFMGIPLEYAILGPKGVFFGIVYVAMFNVFMWSWGLWEMRSEKLEVRSEKFGGRNAGFVARVSRLKSSFSLSSVVNPGTVGIAIGLPLFLFSVTLPEMIGKPVHMMAELNTPFAMLVIGYYLAGADLKELVRIPAVHAAALMRLVAVPLIVIGGLWLFRHSLDRTMALAMVTASSSPAAAMVAMFASKYQRDVDMAVGLVSGTTLLSVLTMPVVIALAMSVL